MLGMPSTLFSISLMLYEVIWIHIYQSVLQFVCILPEEGFNYNL